MNFRLPLQISRVSALCRPSTLNAVSSKFSSNNGNRVDIHKQCKRKGDIQTRNITSECTYRKINSPLNSCELKAFIHKIGDTEKEERKRVRAERQCDNQCPEKLEYASRQTSKINCFECITYQPSIAPVLCRPVKNYDDSTCLYKHKYDVDTSETYSPRMDHYCCCQFPRRQLPRLPPSSCCPCLNQLKKPLLAPPLVPPTRYYDPSKCKWNHRICEKHKSVRMDEAREYKVEQKELPNLPCNSCKMCLAIRPMTAPILTCPKSRYDPTCIPYPHTTCVTEECYYPARRDDCCCEPMRKKLPPAPCSNCGYVQPHVPTECPVLNRPIPSYDSSRMKYPHQYPITPCEIPSLRSDNFAIDITPPRKQLPVIRENKCDPCITYYPTIAPPLDRPKLFNNCLYEEQQRNFCVESYNFRRDCNLKICRSCLPPVPTSDSCPLCKDIFAPCVTPRLVPLEKLYDDTKCKYRHACKEEECCPDRLDDIRCYKVEQKELPRPPASPHCKLCVHACREGPPLCRPRKAYDDTKLKYRHVECPKTPCADSPRADEVTGITDEVKCLPEYKALKCEQCIQDVPRNVPKLRRPYARYNDSCMLYKHTNCPVPCEEAYRRDCCLVPTRKSLPTISYGTINCQPCYPDKAPPLRAPCKLYKFTGDRVRIEECPEECPLRSDDVQCWKPKRKRLPSFMDCDQKCCYTTCSWDKGKQNKLKNNYSSDITSYMSMMTEKEKFEKNVSKTYCNAQSTQILDCKQVEVHSISNKDAQLENKFSVVREPSWRTENLSRGEYNFSAKYYHTIEKWLQEGAKEIARVKLKLKQFRKYSLSYPNFSFDITPVKYQKCIITESSECLSAKNNNAIQASKIENLLKFKSNVIIPPNSPQIFNITYDEYPLRFKDSEKTSVAITSEVEKKRLALSTNLYQQIRQGISELNALTNQNFLLKLSDNLRTNLFKKISDFFKQRESSRNPMKMIKGLQISKNSETQKNEHVYMLNESDSFVTSIDKNANQKPFIVNVGTQTKINLKNIEKAIKNKSNDVESRKTIFDTQQKKQKNRMKCTSKPVTKNEKNRMLKKCYSLPMNFKLNKNTLRQLSTDNKDDQSLYKHINISDDYIGKIYKVKLKKIGVKNLIIEKSKPNKWEDEPHTICYICKVVPRHTPIYFEKIPDMKNIKLDYCHEEQLNEY